MGRPSTGLIYFFDLRDDEKIVRVGYDGSARIQQHRTNGAKLLAIIRGTRDFEERIHRHFISDQCRDPALSTSTSSYEGPRIWQYVEWLVRNGYALTDDTQKDHLASLPWSSIDPGMSTPFHEDDDGQLSLVSRSRRGRIAHASSFAYNQSLSDEWYTPQPVIESARAVMGVIDLDPASCPVANGRIKARHFFSQVVDGLQQQWRGSVWMNPPYGDVGPRFVNKLLEEYRAGHVSEAIALLNLNAMSSKWFQPIYLGASMLVITRGRLQFEAGSKGQASSAPTTGNVFIYLGENSEVFAAEFAKHGQPLLVWRGKGGTC